MCTKETYKTICRQNFKILYSFCTTSDYNCIMFNWFKVKKYKKNKEMKIYVCKHCKLTCRDCDATYCFSCFVNPDNPCPRCGKTNSSFVEENDK